MKKVFKYLVQPHDIIEVMLPENADPLHFDMQGSNLCLWALVNPEEPEMLFRFRMAGTGHPIETCGAYINTMKVNGLVFHFFYA
jgi:hypothetical protein